MNQIKITQLKLIFPDPKISLEKTKRIHKYEVEVYIEYSWPFL